MAKAQKKSCPSCRHSFDPKFANNPRINTALTCAIRAFKAGENISQSNKNFARINNDDRPDEAFTSERAQRAGLANASSGKIFVTVPADHFGPIPPDADPRGTGVKVGESWENRLECRQWGCHLPHVAGIAGQSAVGAQSVVLSGGYEDDRDEGEWFLYTGSGGRDLSGNKRTSKVQSFDQKFELMNEALRLSCVKGLPVRVVRSHKEKRSAYAPTPDQPVRYDGIYRIVACWRKKGAQGPLVCRYLFVRCDNELAPWQSEEGDRPADDIEKNLPKEARADMKLADGKVVHRMGENPWWGWNPAKGEWGWTRPPPDSQHKGTTNGAHAKKKRLTEQERALRELQCELCKSLLCEPMIAPCGHSFCKACLYTKFDGLALEYDATEKTGRSLRVRKAMITCPRAGCTTDIADFMRTGQVNRDMEGLIAQLRKEVEAARSAEVSNEEKGGVGDEEAGQGNVEEAVTANKGRKTMRQPNESRSPAWARAAKSTYTAPLNTTSPAAAAVSAVPAFLRGPRTVAERLAAAVADLHSEFPEVDATTVHSLLEDQDGDVQGVRICLSMMRNNEEIEKKKRSKAERILLKKKAAVAMEDGRSGLGKRGGMNRVPPPIAHGIGMKDKIVTRKASTTTAKKVKVAA